MALMCYILQSNILMGMASKLQSKKRYVFRHVSSHDFDSIGVTNVTHGLLVLFSIYFNFRIQPVMVNQFYTQIWVSNW